MCVCYVCVELVVVLSVIVELEVVVLNLGGIEVHVGLCFTS